MPSFRIINDFAAPCLYHSDQNVWVFRASDSLGREHLRIVASDVFHHTERPARMDIDKLMLGLRGDEVAVFVDEVAGVDEDLRLRELQIARLPEVFAHLRLQFREFAPGFQRLAIKPERGNTGADVILIAVLRHQCELAGNDGHRRFLRNGVRVIGNASARGMVLCFKYILAQFFPGYLQERSL